MTKRPPRGEPEPLPRLPVDAAAYERRSREGPCFVCETLAGNPEYPGEMVWAGDDAVAFLARYNTLLGHTLVAPRAHREQVTGDSRSRSTCASSASSTRSGRRSGASCRPSGSTS